MKGIRIDFCHRNTYHKHDVENFKSSSKDLVQIYKKTEQLEKRQDFSDMNQLEVNLTFEQIRHDRDSLRLSGPNFYSFHQRRERERERERERDRETDRQTDRQTDRDRDRKERN